TGSVDMSARLWDMAQGTFVRLDGPANTVNAVAVAPDGKTLAACGSDGCAFVWDDVAPGQAPGRSRRVGVLDGSARGIALGRDRTLYAVSDSDRAARLLVFANASGEPVKSVAVGAPVTALALSSDERRVFVACGDGRVRSWDAPALANPTVSPVLHEERITALALAPDGSKALTGAESTALADNENRDVRAKLWDLPGWTRSAKALGAGKAGVFAVA